LTFLNKKYSFLDKVVSEAEIRFSLEYWQSFEYRNFW